MVAGASHWRDGCAELLERSCGGDGSCTICGGASEEDVRCHGVDGACDGAAPNCREIGVKVEDGGAVVLHMKCGGCRRFRWCCKIVIMERLDGGRWWRRRCCRLVVAGEEMAAAAAMVMEGDEKIRVRVS